MSSFKKRIKKYGVDIAKKNKFLRKFIRKAISIRKNVRYKKYYNSYEVDDKVIIFEVFGGRNYSCSPKAIYETMITMDEFNDYTFVWAFKNVNSHNVKPFKNLKIVKSGSKEYYKYYSSAKYWIVNSIVDESIKKKENQVYVQCWHGTPLKRLRYDIEVNGAALNTIAEIRKRNDLDAKRFDYFLSPSAFCTEKFTSAFNLKKLKKENIIIEKGYPRNDFLFKYTNDDVNKIKNNLGIPSDKKVILYAPTFRDNQHTSGVGYTYNLGIDFDKLKSKISDDYVILFRTHYFVANSIDLSKYEGFIYDVSKYDDINELYIISDLLITDYSSVFFDYANLKRPILFYMYDLDDYKNNLRDFYISLDSLPGPIAETQSILEDNINNIDKVINEYSNRYKEFNNKYNYLDDSNSSKRVIDYLFKK